MTARLLGRDDEPQNSGALVAVYYGDYRQQEVWCASGPNMGCWYPLGGEFGRPKVWDDNVPVDMWARANKARPQRPPGTVPQHPRWEDILARGPVTLLVGADDDAYRAGWRNGRRRMWEDLEDAVYDEPKEAAK